MESPAPLFKAIYLKLYLEVTKDAFKKLRMGPFFFLELEIEYPL